MAKKDDKKIKWMKPKLEFLGDGVKTAGLCGGGSGDADVCFPAGTAAGGGTACVDGTGGVPGPI